MNLGFKKEIDGHKTGFPEKIIAGLFVNQIIPISKICEMAREQYNPLPVQYHYIDTARLLINHVTPKIHTIREDDKDQWKVGNDIHFIINNRKPNRYQFAPVIPCLSIQKVEIVWFKSTELINARDGHVHNHSEGVYALVKIDGRQLSHLEMSWLVKNDGFENSFDFFSYFSKNKTYKLIHWTNYKY